MVAKKILGARPLNNREKTGLLDKKDPPIPRARQCELLELKRSSSYYKPSPTYVPYGHYHKRNSLYPRFLPPIMELMEENPYLGLRKYAPLLKERYGLEITYDQLRRLFSGYLSRRRERVRRGFRRKP